MSFPGGFGRLGFGPRSFGAGGPLTVVRAGAVASHVVRVVFNQEPLHRSPAGAQDALAPGNYVLDVPGGNGTSPMPVGVDRDPIAGPAYLVAATEFGMDVHVDRAMVFGVLYNVRARNVVAAIGGALGTPDNADFGGATKLSETKLPDRNQDLIDVANVISTGAWFVDGSGDLAAEDPDVGTRKRVIRRMTTKLNAFKHLKGYGLAIDHKTVGTVSSLSALKTDAIRQVGQEPDIVGVAVQVSLDANGVTTIATRARTRRGTFVDVQGKVSALGQLSAA